MPLDRVTTRLRTRCVKHRRLGEVETSRREGDGDRQREIPGSESAGF